jgi:outer membrane murein-binding lipoprotein Lpp
MRRARAVVTTVLLVGAAAGPVTARAQTTVAEQRARVERLRARVAAIEAARAARDSADRARRRLDTLVVGGLTLVTDSSRSLELRTAAASVWQSLVHDLGATPASCGTSVIYVRLGARHQSWNDLLHQGAQFVEPDMNDRGEILRRRLRIAAGATLARRAGPTLSAWTGGTLGLHVDPDASFARAATELVTTLSVRARGCNAGNTADCALALGITPADDPVHQWYDAGDRQALVRRLQATFVRPRRALASTVDDCLQRANDDACVSYLQQRWVAPGGHPPISTEAAVSVLYTAARLGGAGALDRLLADSSASLAARLEAMAGVPLDSLIDAWRDDARAHRSSPPSLPESTRWAALFWIAAFGTLALRNTRWS